MSDSVHFNSRVIVAAIIALVGIVVGWRALSRSAPNPPTSAEAPTAPAEAREVDLYEIRPTPGAEAESARRLADAFRVAPSADLAAAGVTRSHMDAIAEHASERLTLMLEGASLDRIVETMRALGMDWTEPELPTGARERFEGWPAHWRLAAMSSERSFVRSFVTDDPDAYEPPEAWQSVIVRNPLRARPSEILPGTPIVELVIPALARAKEGAAPSMPCSVGISYMWDTRAGRWSGGMFTIYIAASDSNRLIPPP